MRTPTSWARCSTDVHAPAREQQTQAAAQRRQHQRLGKQLPRQAPAPGAERGAQCDLAPPDGAARQQQVREVGAGDQQNQPHGPEQHPQGRPRLVDRVVEHGLEPHDFLGVVGRKCQLQLPGDGGHLGARPGHADAEPQPSDRPDVVDVARLHRIRLGVFVPHRCRQTGAHPEIHPAERPESLRHDADHGKGAAVQLHGAAESPRIAAEAIPPRAVGEHRRARAARAVDRRLERAAAEGRHAEDGEEVRRHLHALEPERLGAGPGEDEVVPGDPGELLEAPAVALVVEQVGRRGRSELATGLLLAEDHQLAARR
jgi:hypothetical protein